ncbi:MULTISPECIES: YiiD C-terminal domain-containing protein [Lysobacteraceae]|uniref:YiiD C-terminal domain-containing protein n=1 Tax=Novilysobacter avium TaxID=2781023 RepID=A0A7S6ZUH8_9GAMM|nr:MULTISPECIES: YiiD C-terminal domain-containing protein [Lysobacter]QOW22142.1 YiiD C-terminal domain-containing protein [Lysobacter avium]QOW24621.1 YiiD C-terminal domain-containing protein [Lysobacter sp. H23M47]
MPQSASYSEALQGLEQRFQSMPPVAAMAPVIESFDGDRLCLTAPLALHVNDKGCAFGGSMVSLMTLASWGLVTMQVEAAGIDAGIYVADSQVRYLHPVYDDLRITAGLAPSGGWDAFIATLRQRRRARVSLVARLMLADGRLATDFSARYVAIAR